MKRTKKKVAVIGSGIMGSGIACHFANIGVEVLLDIVLENLLKQKQRIDIRK
jgi:3-hydroxyacyl-CoA dehydrogenase